MSKQQLHCPKIFCAAVDQRNLRAPHGVSAVRRLVQSDGPDPSMYQPRVLPRREMRR
jgi:hypothetical protein